MKYTVRVAEQTFEVEIEDIYARPVTAYVDGQEFKVHLENGVRSKPAQDEAKGTQKQPENLKPVELPKQTANPNTASSELTAPLPGTVIEIFVKAGEQIESGQVILIIEAMKMKNSIRSTRAGKIAEVLVEAGQTVAHKQALVRFG